MKYIYIIAVTTTLVKQIHAQELILESVLPDESQVQIQIIPEDNIIVNTPVEVQNSLYESKQEHQHIQATEGSQLEKELEEHLNELKTQTQNEDSLTNYEEFMYERFEDRVKLVEIKNSDGYTVLTAQNSLYAPIEIEVSFSNTFNANIPKNPIRWLVGARSSSRIITLKPTDATKNFGFNAYLRYAIGDPRIEPTEYQYIYPWVTDNYWFTQGPNGSYSHFTVAGRYAVDIGMVEGTPIIAARPGIVVRIENNQTGRGTNPSGNFIRILHDDGTMAVYLHLQKDSIIVKEGDFVFTGQKIADSGNTGRSTGPHLHFAIQRNIGMRMASIPFKFRVPKSLQDKVPE